LLRRTKKKEKMLLRPSLKDRRIFTDRLEEDSLLKREEIILRVKKMKRMTSTCRNPLSLMKRRKSLATSRRQTVSVETRLFKMKRRRVMRRKRMVIKRTCRLTRANRTMMMRSHRRLLPQTEFQRQLISSRATPTLPQKARSIRESTQRALMRSHLTSSSTTSLENMPLKRRITRERLPEISS